ncbi:MAG: DTW domain-containing protein [Deltaproteobacteria bacterium]|nr:DTW domain-containing protein [Deltaproteobacteria bacterium]
MSRNSCRRCLRPESLCLCAAIVPIFNRTTIVLLQHPGERRHPFNTAIIAKLALQNVHFDVHWNTKKPLDLSALLPPGTALLYPGPTATNLDGLRQPERPTGLVVLDGTWWGAKKLLKVNPVLASLPKVSFPTDSTMGHKLRREPAAGYMSTVEAIHLALTLIEPETANLESLMRAYDRLVEGHLSERARRRDSRYRTRVGPRRAGDST